MRLVGNIEDFQDRTTTALEDRGVPLLLLRLGQKVVIYRNRCPHSLQTLDPMGGSVASPDGLLIHCQRHAAVFLADTGECVGGPCPGENLAPVDFTLRHGDIFLH